LTELDDAMLERMTYIVYVEKSTFSFKDFCRFEVKGKEYKMSHGTFRNKISKLTKKGIVKLEYISHIAFYTLQVKRFDASTITHDHTGGTISYNSNNNNRRLSNSSNTSTTTNYNHRSGNGYLYDLIMNLSLEHKSIHDIRLNFKVEGIWSMLYNHYNNNSKHSNPTELSLNIYNKDILFPTWKVNNDILIRVTVHKTNTVSIIVACSLRPILINYDGISKFTEMLTRTEERISNIIQNIQEKGYCDDNKNNDSSHTEHTIATPAIAAITIPHYNTWIVTMWHFGADSMLQCTGEKFSITFKDGRNVLLRVYTKQREHNDTRICIERQEYPRKSIIDAINEKLDKN
jgi:hypothetical protein